MILSKENLDLALWEEFDFFSFKISFWFSLLDKFDETDEQAWDEIRINQVLSQGHLICCVESLKQINKCKELNLKFYYGYPINSFYELHSLVDLGVCYVRLAPPLSHQLEEVSKFGVPIRAIPNVCYQKYIKKSI